MRQVVTTKRTRRTYRPELNPSPGPAVLAAPGDGSYTVLHGHSWALAVYRDGPEVLQAVGGEWVQRDDPEALAGLVRGVRHVDLAFDQAARPVVAWEHDGLIYVRQYDGLTERYVTRGPWPGVDPLLICDAVLNWHTADSDVVLLHLTPDRAALVGRIQRDTYAQPMTLLDVPPGSVLDQVTALPFAWQALGETPDGARLVIRSGPYPVRVVDTLAGAGVPDGGELLRLIHPADAADAVAGGAVLDGGALVAQLYPATLTETVAGGAALDGGSYVVMVFPATLTETVAGGATLDSGSYVQTILPASLTDTVTGGAEITGGSYA